MKSLTKNIMAFISIIPCENSLQQYNTYILPVLLYGSEMWDMTVRSSQRLDAFDQWCLRHILRVPFTAHVTNQEVRRRSTQPPVTQTVMLRRLRFFGPSFVPTPMRIIHVPSMVINDPPKEWRRPRGRRRQTWLRTIENDLKHQNLGLWSARHRAYDRDLWCDIVETATLQQGHAT